MLRFLTAKSHNVKSNFRYINWQELINKIESPINFGGLTPETAKSKSEIIATTDAIDKTKENVLAHDNFTMLRLDLDETELDVNGIEDALNNMCIASFIIHTTARSLPNLYGITSARRSEPWTSRHGGKTHFTRYWLACPKQEVKAVVLLNKLRAKRGMYPIQPGEYFTLPNKTL